MRKTNQFINLFKHFTSLGSKSPKLRSRGETPSEKKLCLEALEERQLLDAAGLAQADDTAYYASVMNEDVIDLSSLAPTSANLVVTSNSDDVADTGSLRYAIANAAAGDTITFDSSLAGETIVIGSSFNVEKTLTIDATDAPGLTIDGNDATRHFQTGTWDARGTIDMTLSINGLNFINGNGTGSEEGRAGSILAYTGTINLTNCSFSGNEGLWGGVFYGHAFNTLNVDHCVFTDNTGVNEGGAINSDGSTVKISNSVFTDNFGNLGGALRFSGANVTVDNSIINNNSAGHGGVARFHGGTYLISNTVMMGNTVGGNLHMFAFDNVSTITLYNCTAEGAISDGVAQTLTMYNSIFINVSGYEASQVTGTNNLSNLELSAGNYVYNADSPLFEAGSYKLSLGSQALDIGDNSKAVDSDGDALTVDVAGKTRIINEIVDIGAYEFQTDIEKPVLTATPAINSSISTSWAADSKAASFTLQYKKESETDWTEVSVDSGNSYLCEGLDADTVYQFQVKAIAKEGFTNSDWSDIVTASTVFVEEPSVVVTTNLDVVSNTDGLISLREAIAYANDTLGMTITFDQAFFTDEAHRTLELDDGEFFVNKPVTIDADVTVDDESYDITLDAHSASRIVTVSDTARDNPATFKNLVFKDGSHADKGGAVLVLPNTGAAFISCDFINNRAAGAGGGAIRSEVATTFIDDCYFEANWTSGEGGAICNDTNGPTDIVDQCVVTVKNSEFVGNKADGFGAALRGYFVTFYVDNSYFSGNQSGNGSVLRLHGGNITMSNSLIEGNDSGGGAVRMENSATATLYNCTLIGNTGGGAITAWGWGAASSATLYNTIVVGNSSDVAKENEDCSVSAYNSLSSYTSWNDASNNVIYNPQNPLFEAGSYKLCVGSQALDHGDNAKAIDSAGNALTVDVNGYDRIVNTTVDIGASEHQMFVEVPELEVAPKSTATLTASWNVDSKVDYYILQYKKFDAEEWTEITVDDANEYTVTGLELEVVYDFQVKGFGLEGYTDSEWSDIVSATPKSIEFPSVVVTTNQDVVDPTDGWTSLREAIAYAGTNELGMTVSFDQTIFADEAMRTLVLAQQFEINKAVAINGSVTVTDEADVTTTYKITLDGNSATRFFAVSGTTGNAPSFRNLNMINGKAERGGAALVSSDALFVNCSFLNNIATGGAGGGAIRNEVNSILTVDGCYFEANSSSGEGGAINNDNNGEVNGDTTANTILIVKNSQFVNNHSNSYGGAIRGYFTTTRVDSSVFTGNSAPNGSLIRLHGGYFSISNSLAAGNTSSHTILLENTGSLSMHNSTFSGNTGGYAVRVSSGTYAYIYNSILVNNDPNSVDVYVSGSAAAAAGYNVLTTAATSWKSGENQYVYDASKPLFAEGGYTLSGEDTQVLDLGNDANALNVSTGSALVYDLSGDNRFSDTVDLGAYEVQKRQMETFSTVVTTDLDVVDKYDGLISLREAMAYAGTGELGMTVTFDASLKGATLVLNSVLETTRGIAIDASELYDAETNTPGITISGNNATRHFYMHDTAENAVLTLKGLSLVKGNGTATEATDGQDGRSGSLLWYSGGIDVSYCVFSNNVGKWGGCTYTYSSSPINFSYCTFVNNRGNNEGGVLNFDGSPTATINDCLFQGNSAGSFGGALRSNGATWIINNSAFLNNSAGLGGVARFRTNGEVRISNSLFAGNTGGDGANSFRFEMAPVVTITNSTVIGAMVNAEALQSITAYNSIILENSGFDASKITGSNNLADLAFGSGNFTYDASLPLFEQGSYKLCVGSQALDLGDNSKAVDTNGTALTVDMIGHDRFVNEVVDLGAYEFQMFVEVPELTVEAINTGTLSTSWNSDSKADSYQLEYRVLGVEDWISISVDGGTSYEILNLEVGTQYELRLKGLAKEGYTDSEWSDIVVATPREVEAPAVVVTTNLDVVDKYDGLISLREAIAYASEEVGMTITFDQTFFADEANRTIVLTQGQFNVSKSITIIGDVVVADETTEEIYSITINANAQSRIVQVTNTTVENPAVFSNLIFINGRTGDHGGAALVQSSATFNDCDFLNNYAGGSGGALRNEIFSTMTVNGCYFSGNVSPGEGAAINNDNNGTVNADSMANTKLILNDSIFDNNGGSTFGGALRGYFTTFIVNNTYFSNNYSVYGGVLRLHGGNITISNSVAINNRGDGTSAFQFENSSTGTFYNCTITGGTGGAAISAWGWGAATSVTLYNTILAGNSSDVSKENADCKVNGYYSLSGFTSWDAGEGNVAYDAARPLFAGGYVLASDSQAIDLGNNSYALNSYGEPLTVDYDGEQRIRSTSVDIGAFEYQMPVATPNLTVDYVATDAISVKWDAVANITGYTLQYKQNADSEWITIELDPEAVSYVFAELNADTLYDIQIQALATDAYVDSSWAAFSVATVTKLAAPTGLNVNHADYTDTTWLMTWNDANFNTSANFTPAASFTYAYCTVYEGMENEWNEVNITVGDSAAYSTFVEGLLPGMTYHVRIMANTFTDVDYNAPEASDWSEVYSITMKVREEPSTVVTTLEEVIDIYDGKISLREALNYASEEVGMSITFAEELAGGTLAIATQFDLNKAVEIDGGEVITIDCQGVCRAFQTTNASEDNPIVIKGLTLKNGNSERGSAVFAQTPTMVVDCNLLNNYASSAYGAGAVANDGTIVTIDGCYLSGNSVPTEGGAVNSEGGVLYVYNSTFEGNTAGSYGGAIRTLFATVTIEDTVFTGNRSNNYGGAFRFYGSTVNLTGCSITNNTSAGSGGVLRNEGGSNVTFTDCVMTGNSSSSAGGTISNTGGCTVTLNNVNIADSSCSSSGGALDNRGTMTVNGATITNASAGSNGGIFYNTGTLVLNNVETRNGRGGTGGGLYNTGTVTTSVYSIYDSTSNNYGGGIYNTGTLNLFSATIIGNVGVARGGGIYNTGNIAMESVAICNNSASSSENSYGGGVSNWGKISGSNVTIAYNNINTTASSSTYYACGGGLSTELKTNVVTLNNSIIVGNTATAKIKSRAKNADVHKFATGIVQGNNNIGTSTFTWNGSSANNVNYNASQPLFVNVDARNYALPSDSQAVNKGNNAFVTKSLDVDGKVRIYNNTVDIGAYEYAVLNAPTLTATATDHPFKIDLSWNMINVTKEYTIQYKASTSGTWITYSQAADGKDTSFTVEGLKGNTSYDFRIKAVGDKSAIDSAWSNVATATTIPAVLETPVITAEAISDSEVTVSWTAYENAGGFALQYKLASAEEWTDFASEIAGTDVSATVDGLVANTEYSFRLKALGNGEYTDSEWSESVNATTEQGILAVPELTLVEVAQANVTLNWNAIDNASSYMIRYSLNEDMSDATEVSFTESGNNTVKDLVPLETYYFQVKAVGDGVSYLDSDWSATVSAETTKVKLAADFSLAYNANGMDIDVTLANAAGAASYTLRYSTDSEFAAGSYKTLYRTASGTYTITDLDQATTYYFRLYVSTSDADKYENSGWSANQEITTKTKLATMEGLGLSSAFNYDTYQTYYQEGGDPRESMNSLTVTYKWGKDYANAAGYIVQYSTSASFTTVTEMEVAAPGEYTIDALRGNMTYYFRVCAKADPASEYANGDWFSTEIKTKKVTLDAPTLEFSSTGSNIKFTFDEVYGARNYSIRYSTNADMSGYKQYYCASANRMRTLSGLQANTTYYFQSYSANAVTTSAFTASGFQDAGSFTSKTDLARPTISATAVDSSTIQVVFTEIENAVSYIVKYSKNTAFTDAIDVQFDTAGAHNLENLEANTKYFIKVTAYGEGIYGQSKDSVYTKATTAAADVVSEEIFGEDDDWMVDLVTEF